MKPLTLTTPTDTQVRIERHFTAPVALVWRAFTEPPLIQRWLTGPPDHTMPFCEVDLQVGGKWRYVWSMPDGQMTAFGEYREIVAEQRIVHTERYDSMAPDQEALIGITFAEKDSMTAVVMLIEYSDKTTRDAMVTHGMAEGLEASYTHLDDLLEHVA